MFLCNNNNIVRSWSGTSPIRFAIVVQVKTGEGTRCRDGGREIEGTSRVTEIRTCRERHVQVWECMKTFRGEKASFLRDVAWVPLV